MNPVNQDLEESNMKQNIPFGMKPAASHSVIKPKTGAPPFGMTPAASHSVMEPKTGASKI